MYSVGPRIPLGSVYSRLKKNVSVFCIIHCPGRKKCRAHNLAAAWEEIVAFLGGGNSPKTDNFLPNGCQIVCSTFFSARAMNYTNGGNFLLLDNKRRKLFVIMQSKVCKFMPKQQQ